MKDTKITTMEKQTCIVACTMANTITNNVANTMNFSKNPFDEKLEKFNGIDLKRWQ